MSSPSPMVAISTGVKANNLSKKADDLRFADVLLNVCCGNRIWQIKRKLFD